MRTRAGARPGKGEAATRPAAEDETYDDAAVPKLTARTALFVLVPLASFLLWLVVLLLTLPSLPAETQSVALQALRPPHTVADAVALRDLLATYSEVHGAHVAALIASVYIFMQCFAIPGSLTLSLLAGALFGPYRGLALVIFTNLCGSSLCFAINTQVGRAIAYRLWPTKIKAFKREVDKRRSQMTNYIFFLRVTPFLPNTFINVASPVVHVPYSSFAIGGVLGLLPNNVMAIKAGMKLSDLTSLSELYDVRTVGLFAVIGFLFLLPAIVFKPPDLSGAPSPKKAR